MYSYRRFDFFIRLLIYNCTIKTPKGFLLHRNHVSCQVKPKQIGFKEGYICSITSVGHHLAFLFTLVTGYVIHVGMARYLRVFYCSKASLLPFIENLRFLLVTRCQRPYILTLQLEAV